MSHLDDTIIGTEYADLIIDLFGDNIVHANQGDNVVATGYGDDLITATDGDDIVEAGSGDDYIHVNDGKNLVLAGSGNDVVTATNDDDIIFGQSGNDQIWANEGNNFVHAGTGNNMVGAGQGDDIIVQTYGFSNFFDKYTDDYLMAWANGGHDTLVLEFNGLVGFAKWALHNGGLADIEALAADLEDGRIDYYSSENMMVGGFEEVKIVVNTLFGPIEVDVEDAADLL